MAGFEGAPRGTLADYVYGELRAAILSGSIRDGSELNQVGLAKEFEVSRVPVREALMRLQAERLITVTPYQQYIVRAIDPSVLLELLGIRAELEVFGVKRQMQSLDDAYVKRMRSLNAQLRRRSNTHDWLLGDIDFHVLLDGEATETARMVRDIRERVHRYLQTTASSRERQAEACTEHDKIIDAMVAGDEVAAEAALREHISHTRTVILDYLRTHHPEVFAEIPEPLLDGSVSGI